MSLRLYDTACGEVIEFAPPKVVRIYVCGITPYDSTHLGHAATYLAFDLLVRRLEDLGHEVRMVRNVTDVDDSILPKAKELGIDYLELADREMARFHGDLEALNMRPAFAEPRATQSIDAIVELVGDLLNSGNAYEVQGTIYFDVKTFPQFGALSGLSEEEMIALAAERGGTPFDPRQRNPLDFVLWKPSTPGEPSWPSPMGEGRPGWHIECSAMSMAVHGPTLDLHGGGSDLVFPHHECEIAQSQALTGKPFAVHWMHSAMVAYEGTKMSKSLGNLVFVSELLADSDPRAVRLALMRHHYRAGFEWHEQDLEEGNALLRRLLAAASGTKGPDPRPFLERARACLDDDLDVPGALDALDDLASAILSEGTDSQDYGSQPIGTQGDDSQAVVALLELGALLGVNLTKNS